MRKVISTIFGLLLVIVAGIITLLSINGYETSRFNGFISQQIKNTEPDLDFDLKKIKIKINLKELDLFLSTKDPIAKYKNVSLPINELKIYLDFFSLIKNKPHINRTSIAFNELSFSEIKKLIVTTKPSNFKSFVLNNVSEGNLKGFVDLNLSEDLKLIDYKISAKLKKLKVKIFDNVEIKNANFNFIADSSLVLINSISLNFEGVPITNGLINIDRKDGFLVEGSLNTELASDSEKLSNFFSLFSFSNSYFLNKNIEISGSFLNKFKLDFDSTLKLKKYDYDLTGEIKESKIIFEKTLKSSFLRNEIKEIFFNKTKLKIRLNDKKENKIFAEGLYKLSRDRNYSKYKIDNSFNKSKSQFNVNLDFNEYFLIEILNYEKKEDEIANITAIFDLADNEKKIKNINYQEGNNLISLNKIEIDKNNQIKKFENIKVKTFKDKKENNNFEIMFGKKIIIKGKNYDSTNLIKNINKNESNNTFKRINKEIRISFENILTKLSIPLNNFNLIGKIEKGKFVKISSKSEFSKDQYLDISLKKDLNNNKKTLEIYSGFAKPLLADFKFFKGIEGGQLLFTSTFDEKSSSSNLQIKDFKVLNAPAFAKLLALADLAGIAVLLSGEGLDFESMEIKFNDNKKIRTISEIYAVSPSLTILMEGYIENKTGLTSLRGTMVPAKEINKLISKIPVLGDILIGKEVGEGVFGVSFKMKGPAGKIKTTVNPIKTLTPRFITRALEKRKKKK